MPSNRVSKGNAVVSDEVNYLCSNNKARGKDLKIEVENIYYSDELNLKVSSTYTKNSFTRLTGYKEYEQYKGAVFVNEDEYISLFNKEPYQSSIFVKDADNEKMQETINNLQKIGVIGKPIKEFKILEGQEMLQVIKIFKVVITSVLIFALFFISYFIIRIILKSRNVYFTTLRMLGATTKNVKKILDIELFINSSLAYLTCIVFILLNQYKMVNVAFVQELIEFLSLREYIVMYAILIIMSILISRRVSRKIFKKSAIKTYNEEV